MLMFTSTASSTLGARSLAAGEAFFLQSTPDAQDAHLTMIFTGIAAISLLVLAIVVVCTLLVLAYVGLKAKASIGKTVDEVKGKAYPIIDKTNSLIGTLSPTVQSITEKTNTLIGDLSPKINGITEKVHGISGQVEEISVMMKGKLAEFGPTISAANETLQQANVTVRDANEKTHQQVARVNDLVTSVLNKTSEITDTVHRGIRVPAREIAGVVSGAKATIDSLFSRTKGFGAGIKPGPRTAARSTTASSAPPSRESSTDTAAQVRAAASAFARAERNDLDL